MLPLTRARRAAVAAAALATAAGGLLALAPGAAATPWGGTGANYSGGIVCTLPGGVEVPMARWAVSGGAGFATDDVVRRGPLYGPAPSNGFAAPMIDGQAGLSGADIAAAAYLIEHHGSGSAAEVAETSADIAELAGSGATQARCLGQQGTSATRAAALLAAARRYAGPYSVTVGAPGQPSGAGQVPVSATVRSAAGTGTPGLTVRFAAGSGSATAVTDASGVARATLPAQRATTTLQATVDAHTGLTYVASNPPALYAGAPSSYSGTGRLGAVAPKPVASVVGSADLVLASGRARPAVQVGGTYGYSGSGQLAVSGPVQAPSGRGCSALPATAFAGAAQVWVGGFDFHGDGAYTAGDTTTLDAGCYLARATVTTTDSDPPVRATSAATPDSVFTVADVSLTQAATTSVAAAGPLATTVTATAPSRATVTSAVVARGPLPTATGDCAAATGWSDAPYAASSDPQQLTARPAGASTGPSAAPVGPTPSAAANDSDTATLGATVSTPAVSRTGCYSLVSQTTVTLDGKSVTVTGRAGAKGSTTLVAKPLLSISNSGYDGEIGRAMTGTVTVSGTYGFAGRVSVGLIATTVPENGCHPVTFADRSAVGQPAVTATKGDGTYSFRSPRATRNLCYSVVAVLSLDANRDVRSNSTSPSADTIFLAGYPLRTPSADAAPNLADRSLLRPALTVGITYGLLLATALLVVLKAAGARRPSALRRPAPLR